MIRTVTTIFALPFVLAQAALASQVADGGSGMGNWDNSGFSRARLIFGQPEGAQLRAGFEIDLEEGWKTYWRAPGEAGIPPVFDWSTSENIRDIEVLYPAPDVLKLGELINYGYKDDVILPLRITLADPEQPATLRLSVHYGVCADLCAPADADLEFSIPPGGTAVNPHLEAQLASFEARVPAPGSQIGVEAMEAVVIGEGDERLFSLFLKSDGQEDILNSQVKALLSGSIDAEFGDVAIRQTPEGYNLSAPLYLYSDEALDTPVTLTVLDAMQPWEVTQPVTRTCKAVARADKEAQPRC